MDNTQKKEMELPALGELSVEFIHQSKYILNAAIIEVLRDKHPEDVSIAKTLIFEILESEDPIYERVKYTLIDGRFLDAASQLYDLADRSPDMADELYCQAGCLYAPFMAMKSVLAFEKAQACDADISRHHGQLVRLYARMGDEKKRALHQRLEAEFLEDNPELKPGLLKDKRVSGRYAANVEILPITLGRDGRTKFRSSLKLDSE